MCQTLLRFRIIISPGWGFWNVGRLIPAKSDHTTSEDMSRIELKEVRRRVAAVVTDWEEVGWWLARPELWQSRCTSLLCQQDRKTNPRHDSTRLFEESGRKLH